MFNFKTTERYLIIFSCLILSLCAQAQVKTIQDPKGNVYHIKDGKILRRFVKNGAYFPPKIPIAYCSYQLASKGAHFDCDDFSQAYKLWWDKNHPEVSASIFQIAISYSINGVKKGHALNVLEHYSPSKELHHFCLVEPQFNREETCWKQRSSHPQIPEANLKAYLSTKYNVSKEKIKLGMLQHVLNDTRSFNEFLEPEEKNWNEIPASKEMFMCKTGLNPDTMLPQNTVSSIERIDKIMRRVSGGKEGIFPSGNKL